MKKDKKKLLIVDDEEVVLNSLVRSFSMAKYFEYETTAVLDLKEVVNQELEDVEFDICIVDLGFGRTDREPDFMGLIFMAMIARSELNSSMMRIVYSGHPAFENVVRAMQLGATDFVSKANFPPHLLVERVESVLIERRRREEQWQVISEFTRSRHEDFCREVPGRVLAIVIDETGPEVITHGQSRLDALLKYAERRRTQPHSRWPVEPHLHIVPPMRTR